MNDARRIRQELAQTLKQDLRGKLGSVRVGRHSDQIDEAAWSETLTVALHAIEADWQKTKQIHAALDRVQSGRYGVCDSCEKTIAKTRLTALPWAARCVGCQGRHERIQASITSVELLSIRDGFEQCCNDAA
jgi:RNA polymerase-binding transcription factor DksA